MTGTQIFAAIDAVRTISVAVLPPSVTVKDGPITVEVPEQDFLIVGSKQVRNDGNPIVAVDSRSEWIGLGALHRDEYFTIWNNYVAWSNDPDLSAARARTETNMALIENELRGPGGIILNGAVNQPGWVGLEITAVSQVNAGHGVEVHTLFGIVCRGRI